jgi:glycosyltransferase involved in cell wall biosynthesis
MPEIALGTKIFSRVDKLEGLLNSVSDAPIDSVYIADDGKPNEEKKALYEDSYEFDLEVLDLEYDAGVGPGRNRIVEASDEPYLLMVDCDHEIPPDVDRLFHQLKARPDLGGVAGLLFERGKIRGVCHDLYRRDDVLVRDVREKKKVHRVAGYPLVEYDFVPNVILLRRECLEDCKWDPEYVIGKNHLDFFFTYKQETDWSFAVNPVVLFDHYPGGDTTYTTNRDSMEKLTTSKRYFLDKWDLRAIVLGRTDWTDATRSHRTVGYFTEQAIKRVLLSLPPSIQVPLMRLRDAVRRRRGRRPI